MVTLENTSGRNESQIARLHRHLNKKHKIMLGQLRWTAHTITIGWYNTMRRTVVSRQKSADFAQSVSNKLLYSQLVAARVLVILFLVSVSAPTGPVAAAKDHILLPIEVLGADGT